MSAVPLTAVPASAQVVSDTETVQARAAILTQGSMAKMDDFNFGDIVRPTTAGTVILAPTANPTCGTTGGVVARTGPCTSAYFRVRERKKGIVRIRQSQGGVVTLSNGAGGTMTMNALTVSVQDMVVCPGNGAGSCNGGGGLPLGTLGRYQITSDDGFAEFRLGGTLNVGANQPLGTYSGQLLIEVLFN